MVKIAIAGGSSQVAHEILDVLIATGKHDITLLSRKDSSPEYAVEGTTWVKVDYLDKKALVEALRVIHTVLSFVDARHDEGGVNQKSLIDASIEAGVKRYAPSEWGIASTPNTIADTKGLIRDYLAEVTKGKALEYSIFRPGLFLNYFAAPHKAAKYIAQLNTWFDFENQRAIVLEGDEDKGKITLTTVQDLAGVVARALEYEGKWPVIGGINANTVTSAEIIALGEKVRGGPWEVTRLKREDVEAGEIKSTWVPLIHHPAIPKDYVETFSRTFLTATLVSVAEGGYEISGEWNKLLPDYEFTTIEKFLTEAWAGKP